MAEACELVEGAIARGERIVVHGDYDVDGICATALAVEPCATSAPRSAAPAQPVR